MGVVLWMFGVMGSRPVVLVKVEVRFEEWVRTGSSTVSIGSAWTLLSVLDGIEEHRSSHSSQAMGQKYVASLYGVESRRVDDKT